MLTLEKEEEKGTLEKEILAFNKRIQNRLI